MKKLLLLGLFLVSLAGIGYGQTWNEWFRQRKTQRKYLLQQIAGLQTYLEYVKKGYRIARDGYSFIHQIKNGEFGLHDLFYSSLRNVNPKLRSYGKIAAILKHQQQIVELYHSTIRTVRESPRFSTAETDQIIKTYNRLLDDVIGTVEQLLLTLSDNKLELTDDERLQRIDKLYDLSKQQRQFSWQYSGQIGLLEYGRTSEGIELDLLKEYYNLN